MWMQAGMLAVCRSRETAEKEHIIRALNDNLPPDKT